MLKTAHKKIKAGLGKMTVVHFRTVGKLLSRLNNEKLQRVSKLYQDKEYLDAIFTTMQRMSILPCIPGSDTHLRNIEALTELMSTTERRLSELS